DGLGSNWITAINEDSKGNMWVGTWGGGLSRLDEDGIHTYDQTNGLPDRMIRYVMEDEEGNILIGTNEHGISIFKGEQFVSWNRDDGLSNSQVWSVVQAGDGRFWYGTNDGISIFDPHKDGPAAFSNFYKLKGNRIRMLVNDTENRIWIATDNQGVFTFNSNNGEFTYEPGLNSYLSSLVVTALVSDRSGRIWTGTLDGLVGYDYDTRKTSYYTQTSGLAGNEITAIYAANDGVLWVGARGDGLSHMVNDSFRIMDLKENFTPTCMMSDQDGRLWVGTEARGVLVIDPQAGKIVREIKESDGLLANLINLVEQDRDGNIYIGTNKGLNIYHYKKDKLYSYTRKNGFVGIETKPNSVCVDNNGYIWFGTVAGVTRFNPFLPARKNTEPLTHIISFRVNLEDRIMKPGLKLNFTENDVIIDYISICLTNPDAVRYQIMLDGADNNWRPVTEQTTVTYPSLAPGRYTFKVKASNSEGYWNARPVTYRFFIRPPFYKTWWFILACIFLVLSVIVVYVKVRERNLVREKRILEDKVMIRTAEVVAQKEELAQKNKDITDSIRYAKRIQFSILPPKIPFSDTFILFKPKDIVSGDFYWMDVIGDLEFMAAVDCTGHGVPGALMSIIGHNSLNKVVREKGILQPAEILNNLNEEVIFNLRGHGEDGTIYDGMDIALVRYDRKKREIEFAGAYNSLIIIRRGELIEVKANRFSIGRSSSLEKEKAFTNHTMKVEEGDTIYIFSDGYADQFGGDGGKKFKAGPMKELFLNLYDRPVDVQKVILDNTVEAWRGNIEQVDDILIVGRRF
ncbi:MAG TPA: two-component regulator propeller domain-containing protein, partial [Bacteroidales bacterium]|nr:two-component regulator propeller domain-containing protein [Bacteroidales bacterium]